MDEKKRKKVSIIIPIQKPICDHVLTYASTFNTCNRYLATRYNRDKGYKVDLKLAYGKTRIKYKHKIIFINYNREQKTVGTYNGPDKYQELELSTYSNINVLYSFINDARKNNLPSKKDMVCCFIMKTGYWHILSKLPKRKIDTIYLDSNIATDLLNDVKQFLNSESLYKEYGIPYKRIYLLEGVPGTGKTSLIFAIASALNKNICIINFGLDVDDYTFMNALSNIPDNCFLVMEDIDKLFINRESKTSLSFSGMLNTLDGLGRKDNLVIFLTTNYRNKLDKALIRPGRVDKEIHFSYATINQIEQIYKKIIPKQINILDTFIKKISHLNLTTAILTKFFFYYKNEESILSKISDLERMIDDYNENTITCSLYT